MTQPLEPTTPPDGQRHAVRQVVLWVCAIVGLIGLILSLAIMGAGNAQSHNYDETRASRLFILATLKTPPRHLQN